MGNILKCRYQNKTKINVETYIKYEQSSKSIIENTQKSHNYVVLSRHSL